MRDEDGGCRGEGEGIVKKQHLYRCCASFLQVIIMGELKDRIIRLIEQNAAKKVSDLAGQYVRAKPEQKETICAAIEVERCVAESCQECLGY